MSIRALLLTAVSIPLVATTVTAIDLPGPTPADRALTQVAGAPNAPAVYLERRGRMIYNGEARSSMLEVYARLKVLKQEGTSYGSISIVSSDFFRVKDITGRTHLPDGTIVSLDKAAKFERHYSDYYDTTVYSCALPGVVPGAIVEYAYRVYFDSIFYPSPWYFQSELPTALSTVSYDIPPALGFAPVKTQTLRNVPIEEEAANLASGRRATFTMHNIPPLPDEVDSFPFSALSSRVMMLPVAWMINGMKYPLLSSWESVAKLAWGEGDYGYLHALRGDRKAKAKAKELTRGLGPDRAKAEALYRFVRDGIDATDGNGIWIGEETVDDVLQRGDGDSLEQALLLQAMLDAAGLDSRLGWTGDRRRFYVQQNLPYPTQLERVVVVVALPEGQVFLDPTDRSAGFGALSPDYQGVPCLAVTRKQQEWTTTPALGAEASARVAALALTLDEEGALAGTGTLHLTGNHAWMKIQWKDTAAAALDGWKEWLERAFPGFDVSDVTATEDVEKTVVDVGWTLHQRAEEVLGDESSFPVARPLGFAANPYALDPSQRLTPLQRRYPETDRVQLTLSWPEGWALEARPKDARQQTTAGSYEVGVEEDAAARRLVVTRSLTVADDEFMGGDAYAALRELFRAAVEGDANTVLLARQ